MNSLANIYMHYIIPIHAVTICRSGACGGRRQERLPLVNTIDKLLNHRDLGAFTLNYKPQMCMQ